MHVNAEETLCAITRLAPPGLATKICNPRYHFLMYSTIMYNICTSALAIVLQCHLYVFVCSFIRRLLQHAMEDSQQKSVLTSSLSVCISLLDREREALRTNACISEHQPPDGSTITVNNGIVVAMLDTLGELSP